MTDEPAEEASPMPTNPAVPEEVSGRARVQPSKRRRWDALPVLYLVGFLVLAGALFYLWRHPQTENLAQATGRVDTLQQQVTGLNGRVGQLESRPAAAASGPSPEVAALQAQVAALSKQAAEMAARPVPATFADLGPVQTQLADMQRQIAALAIQMNTVSTRSATPPVDLGPLTGRVAALEARPQVDLAPVNARIAAIETAGRDAIQRIETRGRDALQQIDTKLAGLDKAGQDTAAKVGALEPRLAAVEAQGKQTQAALASATQRAQLSTRLQAAATALQVGQRLGPIPGAPPALARFADDPPPTDAQLRLSFDQYADAAQKASSPAPNEDKPFAARLWNRAQQVVTVRQGDRVLVGDPISGVLAHARASLDAGDLKGAVDTLADLSGPPAQAIKPWMDQARALLDARAALANMAAG